MKNLRMNQSKEIAYKEAKEWLKNTIWECEFDNLNESTVTDTVDFETIQNRKYYITKIGKKGSKLYAGSEYETKADVGVFEIEMTWDFRHSYNFCLNENNLSRKFTIII